MPGSQQENGFRSYTSDIVQIQGENEYYWKIILDGKKMRESINGTNAEYASVEDLNMHFLRFQR